MTKNLTRIIIATLVITALVLQWRISDLKTDNEWCDHNLDEQLSEMQPQFEGEIPRVEKAADDHYYLCWMFPESTSRRCYQLQDFQK